MKTSTTEPASPDRAADTRERLLLAGLTLFSQLGLEGVRTRQLSEAAGVNQSAIPYHFGGKEGVYAAVLEQTAQDIAARLDLPDAPPATARVAATQLEALMRGFATALLDSEASAARSLLLAREQLQPTPKFEAIHAGLFMPLHEAVTERVAAIRREAPDSRDSILRAHAILGQAIVFAVAREALLRRLGAKRLTRAMVGEIADMVGKTRWPRPAIEQSARRSFLPLLEIPARRCAERAPEHGDETAGRGIAQRVGHRRHRLALRQALQRVDQSRLLPPAAETHAGLRRHQASQRARRDRAPSRPVLQRTGIVRPFVDRARDARQARVRRHGQVQRLARRALDLVQQDVGDAGLGRRQFAPVGPRHGPAHQRLHQLADADHAGRAGSARRRRARR